MSDYSGCLEGRRGGWREDPALASGRAQGLISHLSHENQRGPSRGILSGVWGILSLRASAVSERSELAVRWVLSCSPDPKSWLPREL